MYRIKSQGCYKAQDDIKEAILFCSMLCPIMRGFILMVAHTAATPDTMLLFQAEIIGMTRGFSSNKIMFGPRSPHPKLTFSFQWLETVLI